MTEQRRPSAPPPSDAAAGETADDAAAGRVVLDDAKIEEIATTLTGQAVADGGTAPSVEEVLDVVQAKAASLADAPVKEFVPIIAEKEARQELRAHGVRFDPRPADVERRTPPAGVEQPPDDPGRP